MINVKESEPIVMFFDAEKLNKIITNLVSNAVKFTPVGGKIAIEVKTSGLSNADNDEYAEISVSNTGDGIPEDKLPHIFDRFYQVDGSSKREYEGSGIGLALVKELTELHKGTVSVISSLGTTTFTMRLPLNSHYLREDEKVDFVHVGNEEEHSGYVISNLVTLDQTGETSSGDIEKDAVKERLEVLVVEDNHDLRAMIRDILLREYQVNEAVDGLDGMNKAEAAIPDLIISDVMMPGMNGYDLCKGLKTNSKTNHIPVILLTAKASRENRIEGLETGADDYLVKPFDEEELLVRIRNLITTRENLQRKFQTEFLLRPDEINATSVQQKFVKDLKKVIEENLDNDQFGVDELGRKLAMSRSQVHRKLKAITNQSATTFIRNYRLHRAADLLKQNAGSVTEIAYSVGFNSQTYFSSSFQDLFHKTPSEYRQKYFESNWQDK